jgi:hypothetical protein
MSLHAGWLLCHKRITRQCYATAYNNGGSNFRVSSSSRLSTATSDEFVSQLLTAHLTTLDWLISVRCSVKLLLDYASAVIPGFSHLAIHVKDFYSFLDTYVFKNGTSSTTKEGSVFVCRRYVSCTVVSARVYPRCHDVQVTPDSVHHLSLHCTK